MVTLAQMEAAAAAAAVEAPDLMVVGALEVVVLVLGLLVLVVAVLAALVAMDLEAPTLVMERQDPAAAQGLLTAHILVALVEAH